jgi:DNA-damage-inducible protein J
MAKTDTLHIRVEPEVKKNAENTLNKLGLSTTEAINIFLHQVILTGGLPFDVILPRYNTETEVAMQEARDIASGKVSTKGYASAKELFEELDAEC